VVRGVDLDDVKRVRIQLEVIGLRRPLRVEAAEPVVVPPAGATDAEFGGEVGLRLRHRMANSVLLQRHGGFGGPTDARPAAGRAGSHPTPLTARPSAPWGVTPPTSPPKSRGPSPAPRAA